MKISIKYILVLTLLLFGCFNSKYTLTTVENDTIVIKYISIDSCLISSESNSLHFRMQNMSDDSLIIEYFTIGMFSFSGCDSRRFEDRYTGYFVGDKFFHTLGTIKPKQDTTITLISNALAHFEKIYADSCLLEFGPLIYYHANDKKLRHSFVQHTKPVLKVRICE